MATFYTNSSNDQRDSATMHYLREHLPATYPESQVLPGNAMMYMNYPSSSGAYSGTSASHSLAQNNSDQIRSLGPSNSDHQAQQEMLLDLSEWRDGRNEMLLMQPMSPTSMVRARSNLQGQGLSLSLGTQIPPGIQIPPLQFRNLNPGFSEFLGPNQSISSQVNTRNESIEKSENLSPFGLPSTVTVISNSKYTKAAQQLLDEVVNVRTALKQLDSNKNFQKSDLRMKDAEEDGDGSIHATSGGSCSNPQDITEKSSDLLPGERHDLQNKLTKLLSMLDEVDRRYKQYYHQMQIVISSFEAVAGCGAAKPYTALALQTISRHFRCLRDAIVGQIEATRRKLGEQGTSPNNKGVGISRLRYVDQQLRQNRALQQFGMMQQHTWRPQRGLPESSVSILRAWLFEHFLHPYPKDSDKIMLARQTGLTRSQVSNWFINARVRLWKPMIEEMYKEESGEAEKDSILSLENAPQGDARASEDIGEDDSPSIVNVNSKSSCNPDVVIANHQRAEFFQREPHKQFNNDYRVMQSDGRNPERFISAAAAAYHMSELERFGSGGRVSLTLGLQNFEDGHIAVSHEGHHNLAALRGGGVYNPTASLQPETSDIEQNRFNSSQMLYDFVA